MLNVLPTFHIAGQGNGLMLMAAGARNVIFPEFDPPTVPSTRSASIASRTAFLVPAMIQFMLQVPAARTGDFYSTLKAISYGASPITEQGAVDALRTFGATSSRSTASPSHGRDLGPAARGPRGGARRRPAALGGKPIPASNCAWSTRPPASELPEDEVGEIWIRSAQNMKGYWRNPKATAERSGARRTATAGSARATPAT